MKIYGTLIFLLLWFICFVSFANNTLAPSKNNFSPKKSNQTKKKPPRQAKPAPFDAIFPNSEYPGPTIGVSNEDIDSPLTKFLWKNCHTMKDNKIQFFGWINPSLNGSTSKNSNIPLSDQIVPNSPELDQFVIGVQRTPDTTQSKNLDWGFNLTNLFGIDYRFTMAQGLISNQLIKQNNLYGDDPIEAYGQLYFPQVAQGMLLTFGRYVSPEGVESPFAPDNYLITHSLTDTFEASTQTGITSAIKFNNTWTILIGIQARDDVAPWNKAAYSPTLLALVRWVSKDNNDSVWGGINSFNNGKFKGNHDNLQEFDVIWSHRFNKKFFTQTELYYIYQRDAAKGGTCIFGPAKSYASGGGCGPIIAGISSALGAVNYLEVKISDKNFVSFRTDFLDDFQGQRTGFATAYMSYTLGLTHQFTSRFEGRTEARYDFAFNNSPYDNGTRRNQAIVLADIIYRF